MTSRSKLSMSLAMCIAAMPACAQTHYVKKPENVVRAVGVYEWTGELAKPNASRLIPVTLFIDGKLQDAGVYLARPVPMALDTGTVFELDQAGVPKGTLDLAFARHLQATDSSGSTLYDDGWFGYGVFTGEPKPVLASTGKVRQSKAQVESSTADRPHFASKGSNSTDATASDPNRPTMKPPSDSSTTSTTTPSDPDRPTMSRRDGSTGDSTASTASTASAPAAASSAPASTSDDDPDRPTMIRRTPADSSSSSAATPDTSTPADDPDRPTLKKRSPAEQKARRAGDSSVSEVGSLNDDPNRPVMKRGKPTHSMTDADIVKLVGLPVDLHQMVAVSDAVNRPEHDFARPWESDDERTTILSQLQDMARAKLKAYQALTQPAPVPVPATASTARIHRKPTPPPPPIPLADETLKAYTLSYGGAPTFVYSASTQVGELVDYVTLVAQQDATGALKLALDSETDSQHLDRTPRLLLVDVVDAQASNRASLLFEMRAQQSRSFALYRVIGEQAEQIFSTGSTQ